MTTLDMINTEPNGFTFADGQVIKRYTLINVRTRIFWLLQHCLKSCNVTSMKTN